MCVNNNVHKITSGAMMVAVVGVLLVINRQFANLFEVYFLFAMPLPIIIYRCKYDMKYSLITACAMIILSMIISMPTTVFYVFNACIIGIIYGTLVKKNASNSKLISFTIVTSIITNLLISVVFAGFFGLDFMDVAKELENFIRFFNANNGLLSNENISQFILFCAFLGVVMTGFLEGILIHVITNVVLRKLKIKTNKIKPLIYWSINRNIAYICLTFSILFQIVHLINTPEVLQYVIIVLGFLATMVLVFFGYIAILLFGVLEYKKNIGIFVIIISFLLPTIMIPVLVIFGFIYTTTDFRQDLIRRNKHD